MTRDHYKGVPKIRPVGIDKNDSLVAMNHSGRIPIDTSSLHIYDVVGYGARGGGIVDDTAAIQSAIDAACASSAAGQGGIVYFPPRLYKVSARLKIYEDNIKVMGSVRRASRIQFNTPSNGSSLFLFEKNDLQPLLYCGISNLELKAVSDTTFVKYAVDVHSARKFYMHDVSVLAWSNTSKTSVGLRVRGWDNLTFERLAITADIPIQISQNDDGVGFFVDETKDLDNCRFLHSELVADNKDKIAVKIDSGVVYRSLSFRGMAFVHGGISKIDLEEPRRRSTNLRVSDSRFEGFAETDGDVEGTYSIDLQHHINGQLRNLTVDNVLLAEGADPRYGTTTASNWNGIRAINVWRASLFEASYSGGETPITYSGAGLSITGGQLTEQDYGRAVPECEEQWDVLGIPRPRSWWKFSTSNGNVSDQQDAALSGLVDRTLVANGSPTYQQFVDGWHGYHCGFTEASGQRFGLASANTEFSPQDRSAAWLGYCTFTSGWTPGGKRLLITIGSPEQTGSNGPNVYINTSGYLETYAGSTVVTGTVNYLGKSVAILPVYNRTAGTWKTYAKAIGGSEVETISGTYSANVGNSNPKGIGAPDTYTSWSGTVRLAAMWFNEDAEELDGTTLTKLSW